MADIEKVKIKANKAGPDRQPETESEGGTTSPYLQGYIAGKIEDAKSELSKELELALSKQVSEKTDEIKRRLQDYVNQNQTRVIEALAIFIALFTFISINIQIFTKTQDLRSATIFMVLMAFLSMVMVSFPVILLRSNKGDERPKWVWLIFGSAVSLFLVALILSFWLNIPLNIVSP